jgi:hypothetical protein
LFAAKFTALIQRGEWWRLITATYLHAGFLHLILNILSQLVIGFQPEKFVGWWRIAFIYFWSGTPSHSFPIKLKYCQSTQLKSNQINQQINEQIQSNQIKSMIVCDWFIFE